MTHHEKHVELHRAAGELVWDFVTHSGKNMSVSVLDLMRWSANQVDHEPDHPEATVKVRKIE